MDKKIDILILIILLSFISFSILIFISEAAKVQVDVAEVLSVEARINEEPINNVYEFKIGLFNNGSIGYKTRARLDIVNNSNILFTGWANKFALNPGDEKSSNIYWYDPDVTGNVTARIRVYYASEIAEYGDINLQIGNKMVPEDIFKIYDFRTYDDYIRFDLATNHSVENLILFPSRYPKGWVFEQKKIESLENGRSIEVVIPYEAEVFTPGHIEITAVTKDGKYFKRASFPLEKESGFFMYINLLIDYFKNIFRYFY
jgi:hypothetical protein